MWLKVFRWRGRNTSVSASWRVRVLLGSCGLRFHPDGATGLLVRLSPSAARCRRARVAFGHGLAAGRGGWSHPYRRLKPVTANRDGLTLPHPRQVAKPISAVAEALRAGTSFNFLPLLFIISIHRLRYSFPFCSKSLVFVLQRCMYTDMEIVMHHRCSKGCDWTCISAAWRRVAPALFRHEMARSAAALRMAQPLQCQMAVRCIAGCNHPASVGVA